MSLGGRLSNALDNPTRRRWNPLSNALDKAAGHPDFRLSNALDKTVGAALWGPFPLGEPPGAEQQFSPEGPVQPALRRFRVRENTQEVAMAPE